MEEKINVNSIHGTEVYIPLNQTIVTLFENAVGNYPDKTAVSFNNESLTYQQLNQKTNQLSAFLIQHGIKPGDIVGLSLDRSMQMLVSLIAILKAGAVYLPLDPQYPLERIAFMIEDSSAKMLLISERYTNRYKTSAVEVVVDEIWLQLENYNQPISKKNVNDNDLAYIIYTSGSTGKPKGVKITHINLVNFLISMQQTPGIKATDRLLAITTISFDIAGLELYLPLISGAELVIADDAITKDGRLLLDIIEEKEISIMQATPSTWQMMLDSGWQKRYPLKILSGGEPLPKELADMLLSHSTELWNMYGPTETTIWSTVKQVFPGDKFLSIGVPINNTQIYIIDEYGNLLTVNKTGEIYIGGDGVAQGYLNKADLTAEKFVPDIFSKKPGYKLYRTGDIGKLLENGDIQYVGRIDDQVKIRGHRIELQEIETVIAKQQGIKQCLVLAREDSPMDKRLVAYVILNETIDSLINTDTANNEVPIPDMIIQKWKVSLGELLPAYMVPDDFIALKSFPLTPNAKIDRKALPKPHLKTASEPTSKHLIRTKDEQLITDIWEETLGLENLKITDDFFQLGGHSLLAVKVMVAIEKETGKRLPIATLLSNSTIQKLAKQLSEEEPSNTWECLVPIKTKGKKAPIFLIHGSGLNILLFKSISEYFDEEQPVYGVQALGLSHKTKIPSTLEEIAKRYTDEILKVNPNGPYALVGYSLGGFIAFEIAKHLKNLGKEIKLLGIIDTYAGESLIPENKAERIFQKIKRQFYKIPFFTRSFINSPLEMVGYQLTIINLKLQKALSSEIVITKEILTDYEKEIYKNYVIAQNNYLLTPADLKVTLFRVTKRLYFLDDPIYLGWNKFAEKGVEIHEVPGDHKTFLFPPNDEKFANIIQQVLDSKN